MDGQMSDLLKPLILVLDPDYDFLEEMQRQAQEKSIQIKTLPYSSRDRKPIEDVILENYPDILIINLDQDNEVNHGNPVLEVRRVPLPIPPIIIGITSREAVSLKQRCYDYGIDDYLLKPFNVSEVWMRLGVSLRIRSLQHQLDSATRKLSALNLRLSNSNKSLEVMTLTDELTGLNNMRFMTQYLEKQFQLFSRYDRPFAVMMIDLDKFKEVNDRNDHLVGSETIKVMGQIINQSTRASDIKARYGGDEYVVAMPETEREGAIVVAERIRVDIEAQQLSGTQDIFSVTSSIGVASFDKKRHKNFRDIVRDADVALYMAKNAGRNRVVYFNSNVMSVKASVDAGYDESQSAVFTEIKKSSS